MASIIIRRNTKYAFLGLSFLCVAGFFACVALYSDNGYSETHSIKHENHAVNPHFQSIDEKGQPFNIDALKGYLVEGEDDLFLLKSPTFNLNLKNGTAVKVVADKGYLDQEQMNLKLHGSVVVTYGDDVKFRMPFSEIDLRTSEIKGDKSILGGSEKLSLQAGNFHIEEKGAKITLTDKPMLRFNVQK